MALKKNICIAISTYGKRLSNALDVAAEFQELGFSVVIIHQKQEAIESQVLKYKLNGLLIHQINSIGVAKSRNYAIENLSGDFLWFMDDDIEVFADEIESTARELGGSSIGFFVTEVCDECNNKRKKYLKKGELYNKFSVLNIGTIEVIIDLELIRTNGIRFPEFMGAGTDIPVSDEAVFLSRILRKKIKGLHIGTTPLMHPAESSGTSFNAPFLLSKAVAFKLIFGRFIGVVLFSIFVIRHLKRIKVSALLSAIKKTMKVFLGSQVNEG